MRRPGSPDRDLVTTGEFEAAPRGNSGKVLDGRVGLRLCWIRRSISPAGACLSPRFDDLPNERLGERGSIGQRDHVSGALQDDVLGACHMAPDQLTNGVVDVRGG